MRLLQRFWILAIIIAVTVGVSACTTAELTQENKSTATPTESSNIPAESTQQYSVYSAQQFEDAKENKRVLFFHAGWCPTCKAANQEFTNSVDKIPENVVLFKTDYDTQTELKKKYNITYQHTFVLVDEQGNEIKKWNGGGITELIANTK